jgi:D-glucuronyl C5-epimerase-like protein
VLQRVAGRNGEPSIGPMGWKRTLGCLWIVLLCGFALGTGAPAADAAKKKTIKRELSKLYRSGAIDQATYVADLAIYNEVKRQIKRLTGAREAQLKGALAAVEGIAARGQLRAGRLYPLFLTLQRNVEWWSTQSLLANGQRVSFPGSELVWQYVPGQGLQLHPLANFGKLNAYAKSRSRRNLAPNTQLLDELLSIAVPRGGGLAWEYYFAFDGGRPPWVSGLAQGTGLQAIARSAAKLGRMPELLPKIQAGLELFEKAPPTGVRVETDDGVHYAQYSFWPSLRIANGFVQSLVGLYDVAQLTGDPRAAQLFAAGDRTARREVPTYDTGAWSYYSRGAITRESDLGYHTLLRDFLTGLCDRTGAPEYCDAELHFTTYLTVPPELALRTTRLRGGKAGSLKFTLSKISRTSVSVTAPDGRLVLSVAAGTVGRGTRTVAWTPPRKPGIYTVRIDATDLAGNAASIEGPVEVLRPKKRRK